MKLFGGRKNSSRHARKARKVEESIGSELSPSDQFEILVFNKPSFNVTDNQRRRGKKSIMSYFSSDYDDSTVSSITTEDYGGFYGFSKGYNRSDNSPSDWCCCSDTTYTHPTSTDTVFGNSSAYNNSVRDYSMYRYRPGVSSADYQERAAPSRRPKLLGLKDSRTRNRRRSKTSSGGASLFDSLSEDEKEDTIAARQRTSRRRQQRERRRRAAPWNRKYQ